MIWHLECLLSPPAHLNPFALRDPVQDSLTNDFSSVYAKLICAFLVSIVSESVLPPQLDKVLSISLMLCNYSHSALCLVDMGWSVNVLLEVIEHWTKPETLFYQPSN
jgi:hypothetical protein